MIKRLLDILWVFVHPHSWVSIYPSSAYVDKRVNTLITNARNVTVTEYHVIIDDIEFWRGTYPYAYGALHSKHGNKISDDLPYRRTRARLLALEKSYFNAELKA